MLFSYSNPFLIFIHDTVLFFLSRVRFTAHLSAVNGILTILILPSIRLQLSIVSNWITILGAQIHLLTPWYPFPSSFTTITHKNSPNSGQPFLHLGPLSRKCRLRHDRHDGYDRTNRKCMSWFPSFPLLCSYCCYMYLEFRKLILSRLFPSHLIWFRYTTKKSEVKYLINETDEAELWFYPGFRLIFVPWDI